MKAKVNLTTARAGGVTTRDSTFRASHSLASVAGESNRRLFLKLLGGGIFGATAMAAGLDGVKAGDAFEPLWKSAQVLIGNSPADQSPSSVIKCPLFFDNGDFADAFHTLDLSLLRMTGKVRGTVTHRNDTIEPDFGPSVAAAVTKGTDGILYLLVAGEGKVTAGIGFFRRITNAIIRCKYKVAVDQQGDILLIACVDCVIILVRNEQ
jgi:hypothetical protein